MQPRINNPTTPFTAYIYSEQSVRHHEVRDMQNRSINLSVNEIWKYASWVPILSNFPALRLVCLWGVHWNLLWEWRHEGHLKVKECLCLTLSDLENWIALGLVAIIQYKTWKEAMLTPMVLDMCWIGLAINLFTNLNYCLTTIHCTNNMYQFLPGKDEWRGTLDKFFCCWQNGKD